MTMRPKFKLSQLREIGWSQWDPIGLDGLEGRPDDEYDSYLLVAVGRLWNRASQDEVIEYLVGIETEKMGLEERPGSRLRAANTVGALKKYVEGLRE